MIATTLAERQNRLIAGARALADRGELTSEAVHKLRSTLTQHHDQRFDCPEPTARDRYAMAGIADNLGSRIGAQAKAALQGTPYCSLPALHAHLLLAVTGDRSPGLCSLLRLPIHPIRENIDSLVRIHEFLGAVITPNRPLRYHEGDEGRVTVSPRPGWPLCVFTYDQRAAQIVLALEESDGGYRFLGARKVDRDTLTQAFAEFESPDSEAPSLTRLRQTTEDLVRQAAKSIQPRPVAVAEHLKNPECYDKGLLEVLLPGIEFQNDQALIERPDLVADEYERRLGEILEPALAREIGRVSINVSRGWADVSGTERLEVRVDDGRFHIEMPESGRHFSISVEDLRNAAAATEPGDLRLANGAGVVENTGVAALRAAVAKHKAKIMEHVARKWAATPAQFVSRLRGAMRAAKLGVPPLIGTSITVRVAPRVPVRDGFRDTLNFDFAQSELKGVLTIGIDARDDRILIPIPGGTSAGHRGPGPTASISPAPPGDGFNLGRVTWEFANDSVTMKIVEDGIRNAKIRTVRWTAAELDRLCTNGSAPA